MSKYVIDGGNRLKGKINISGNKNAILPCLAACLLTDEEVILKNAPQISDVDVFLELIERLGGKFSKDNKKIKIQCKGINKDCLPQDLVSKLRASILLVGPLLSRTGKISFTHPGGDIIGRRGIDLHLKGFRQLGCNIDMGDLDYLITKGINPTSDIKIFLEIATVTGTENLILASVIRDGTTLIKNAAREPHVVDLCNMLIAMGARIEGIGTTDLIIKGVKKLKGTEFAIGSDGIEFGTYAIAAAVTGGEIEIGNCEGLDLDPIIWPMQKMGLSIEQEEGIVKVSANKIEAIPRLITNVWPGFPTDLMSIMVVLATQANGVSLMHDWIYESRMFFVDKLISMGAEITIADPHRVLVYGPSTLYGRNLETPDIRAGMALVLAALIATGKSIINRAELIDRGYEDITGKLSSLGAKIKKQD